MSALREDLHRMIDGLGDAEMAQAQRVLRLLSGEEFQEEFAEALRLSISQAESGQTIDCHSLEEMIEKVLGE